MRCARFQRLGHLITHIPIEFVHARAAGRLGRLAELAQTDSFITRVLGTDCYTAALAAVNGDCHSLGHEQKTRLALAFSQTVTCTQAGQEDLRLHGTDVPAALRRS